MTPHNNAKEGEIAKSILLPGDPLRAKFIAENFLDDIKCYNEIRGMYGYTGKYKGKEVSVQGTGMGIPSISIYIEELMRVYNVENLIRIGTCGCFQKEINVRDVILALTASTDSSINRNRFNGLDFAPPANFDLLLTAYKKALEKKMKINVGNVLTTDVFYQDKDRLDLWKKWAAFGVLAVEMETSALYTLAAKHKRKALSILTVSDHIVTGEETTPKERQTSFHNMVEIGLEVAIQAV